MGHQPTQTDLPIGFGVICLDAFRWAHHTGDIALHFVGATAEGGEPTVFGFFAKSAHDARGETSQDARHQWSGVCRPNDRDCPSENEGNGSPIRCVS